MVFRSKVDSFFIKFILIVVLIIGIVSFLPLFVEGGTQLSVILLMTSIFIIVTGFILWIVCAIKYVFDQKYLLVKGGPFRSRILYEDITKVIPSKDIFIGYRILSSKDGIEIFYKKAILGSVKISPDNKSEFINELKKRCPNAQFKE